MLITIKSALREDRGTRELVAAIVGAKKAVFAHNSELNAKCWLSEIHDDTEFLVVTGVANFKSAHKFLMNTRHSVRRPYHEKESRVKMPPNIIMVRSLIK